MNKKDLNQFQKHASKFALFENVKTDPIVYLTIGLLGETGEIAEKIKKLLREGNNKLTKNNKEDLILELGDVLWYLSQLSRILGTDLTTIAHKNIKKLESRLKRNKIYWCRIWRIVSSKDCPKTTKRSIGRSQNRSRRKHD
jgi:NTP pyrophosphatase (non-canonical NTP hydrolase)